MLLAASLRFSLYGSSSVTSLMHSVTSIIVFNLECINLCGNRQSPVRTALFNSRTWQQILRLLQASNYGNLKLSTSSPLIPTLSLDGSVASSQSKFLISSIIKSVDSLCRDSTDMQYMLIQTNFSTSPKQLTYKPL